MTTLTMIILLAITALVLVLWGIVKAVSFTWNHLMFWIVAFIATLIFLPITAGMSSAALFGLIVLRLVLINKMFETPPPRK